MCEMYRDTFLIYIINDISVTPMSVGMYFVNELYLCIAWQKEIEIRQNMIHVIEIK